MVDAPSSLARRDTTWLERKPRATLSACRLSAVGKEVVDLPAVSTGIFSEHGIVDPFVQMLRHCLHTASKSGSNERRMSCIVLLLLAALESKPQHKPAEVAQRVADELDTFLGAHVGYLIRFEAAGPAHLLKTSRCDALHAGQDFPRDDSEVSHRCLVRIREEPCLTPADKFLRGHQQRTVCCCALDMSI